MDKQIKCSRCGEIEPSYTKDMCSACYKLEQHLMSPMIKCKCNCGGELHSIDVNGHPVEYIKGHNKEGFLDRPLCARCNRPNKIVSRGICSTCIKREYSERSPMIKCICKPECPVMIHSIGLNGKPQRYAPGHNFNGANNPNFKGYRILEDDYWIVYAPDHPNARKSGYVLEHRKVMADHLGRKLEDWEEIHHKDENTLNNEISNLLVTNHKEHRNLHRRKIGEYCVDPECKSPLETGKDSDGYDVWFNGEIPGTKLCKNCYNRNKKRERDALKPKYSEELANRICSVQGCLTPKSVIEKRTGKPRWYKNDKQEWICQSHYSKFCAERKRGGQ